LKFKNRLSELKVNKKSILALIAALILLTSVMPASAEDTTNSSYYSESTFDTNVAGDVKNNPEITSNTNTANPYVNNILEKQKQGSTLLQFGNGSENKLLIWAGIHGNEEEANIATMRYLENLKTYTQNNTLNGTLYVIPFAIPRDTSVNSRDYGPIPYTYTAWVPYKKGWYKKAVVKWYKKSYRIKKKRYYKWVKRTTYKRVYGWLYKPVTKIGYKYEDPNRIANQPGTPGWNADEFAKNNGINYILDVHSGGGLESYPNGVIFATPGWSGETNWGNYITSQTGAPVEYGYGEPGMVRIQGHNYGINTITLEVERDKGSTSYWADKELNMIKSACDYLFPQLKGLF
jgi:hypothetical protein